MWVFLHDHKIRFLPLDCWAVIVTMVSVFHSIIITILLETALFKGGVYYSSNITEVKGALEVPYHIFNVNIGYITNIYTSIRKNTKINIGGGGLVGYEEVNNGNHLLENGALLLDRSKFIYGGFALVELEIYLNNDINLILRLNEYYHMNSDLGGQFTLFTGIGVRYFLF
ncbi:conjugative transposon protein TraO [Algibacter lectus]|uniref:Conjugative transposon protein TraO n=1 Tax=Algibacter lectus TaxID=221126 RepID=A0A090WJZ6_9FLAO|nr:conjugative transposon protein TraO [Algibacter lectus]